MKNAPFLISSALALLAVTGSAVSFSSSQTSNELQAIFHKKQTEFQALQQAVTLQNQEAQRQNEGINYWNNMSEKIAKPILGEMAYVTAKNKNEKLKALLKEQKFDDLIPNAEMLKVIDKKIEDSKAKSGATNPVPALRP